MIKIYFVEYYFLVFEKAQNCPFYVGAQFIEPGDNGFDKSNPYERKWYFFRYLFLWNFLKVDSLCWNEQDFGNPESCRMPLGFPCRLGKRYRAGRLCRLAEGSLERRIRNSVLATRWDGERPGFEGQRKGAPSLMDGGVKGKRCSEKRKGVQSLGPARASTIKTTREIFW